MAIKACIKAAGSQLTSLSLYGEGLPNALTLKEIGKTCKSLTYLDVCAGAKASCDARTMELAIIDAVKGLAQLSLLRVPPLFLFESFLGGTDRWNVRTRQRHAVGRQSRLHE